MPKLSPRMLRISDYLLPGQPVWDFCCDHGYIGLNAYKKDLFPEVHFVDQVPHIIENLRQRFQQQHELLTHTGKVFFWATSGERLPESPRGTAVIAGVGAHTILQILRGLSGHGNSLSVSRLILGPQNDEDFLMESLAIWPEFIANFGMVACTQVQEGSRTRKLLIFDKLL